MSRMDKENARDPRDEIISNIRASLISTKGKSDIPTLQRDYKTLIGEYIPYRRFGCPNIENFLQTCPGLSVTKGANGNLLVDAVASSQSQHIAGLVSKQKSKRKLTAPRSRRFSTPRTRPQPGAWRPSGSYVRTPAPKRNPPPKSNRPANLNYNQIVVSSPVQPSPGRKRLFEPLKQIQNNGHQSVFDRLGPRPEPKPTSRVIKNPSPPPPPVNTNPPRPRLRAPGTQAAPVPKPSTSQIRKVSAPAVVNRPTVDWIDTVEAKQWQDQFRLPDDPKPFPNKVIRLPEEPEVVELRNRAIENYDPSNAVWNWPSSDESSPQKENGRVSPEIKNFTADELFEYCKYHDFPTPLFKVSLRKITAKSRNKLYDCKIQIGDSSYCSYPEDCHSELDAVRIAVRLAHLELSQTHHRDKQLLISNPADVLKRIPPVIERHFHGLWAKQVMLDYEDIYHERLPRNWLSLIDTLPTIAVLPVSGNNFVLRNCKYGEKNQVPPNPTAEVTVPANTITLTEEGWPIYVTLAVSTVEIWCRQISSPEATRFELMIEEMQADYDRHSQDLHATNVTIGGFYVARYEESWCRVRVLKIINHGVLCFFIDFGDEYNIQRADIYTIKAEYAREPAQAFVCRLAGCEELANMGNLLNHLEMIQNEQFWAIPQPNSSAVDEDDNSTFAVELYNTDDEANINKFLIQQICSDSVAKLDEQAFNRVFVTHASSDGHIFVQVTSEGRDKLLALLEEMEPLGFNDLVAQTASLNSNDLYLKRFTAGKYHRCRINDQAPNGNYFQIYYIDIGAYEIIKRADLSELHPLAEISEIVASFPPLAIQVSIHLGGEIVTNFAERIHSSIPRDQVVLLKVLHHAIGIPVCELFIRSDLDNSLSSITATMLWATEISQDSDVALATNNNSTKQQSLTSKLERLKLAERTKDKDSEPVPSTGILKSPDLPGKNDYFDVRIPIAVNPWNFYAQPYETHADLMELMTQLQDYYGSNNLSPVLMEDVIPGHIYAARHSDGAWYRTSVIKIIHSGSISVFYCDYGYYANLQVNQLIPLHATFLEMPYQAVKARLHGIKPKNNKWSVEDCQYFESMVSGKTFVSILKEVQKDELYKCDVVLSLNLIDTSTTNDINVGELLIAKGIAAATAD